MLIGLIALLSLAAALGISYGTVGFSALWWIPVTVLGYLVCFTLGLALVFLFLWLLARSIDPSVPQTEDSRFMRGVARLVCPAVFTLLCCKVETKGLEQLPKQGRFMLVCNHLGILDPILLLAKLPQAQLAFVSKQENEDIFIVGKLMHRILTQKIDRDNDREALKTILSCIQIIKEDKASIAAFPEGYTSTDHRLHKFRNGVFKIAQRTHVPIVVCTVTGTEQVFRNFFHHRRSKVTLHLLQVLSPEELAGHNTTQMGDRVHALMEADLPPAYRPEV